MWFLKTKKSHKAQLLCLVALLFLVAQLLSASRSSAGKHFATVRSGHSFTETMFHLTMPFFRLIRTKHVFVLLSRLDPTVFFRKTQTVYLAKTHYILTFIKKSRLFCVFCNFTAFSRLSRFSHFAFVFFTLSFAENAVFLRFFTFFGIRLTKIDFFCKFRRKLCKIVCFFKKGMI